MTPDAQPCHARRGEGTAAPRTPFALGGDLAVENLYAASQVELMRVRGRLATQLQGLPDGAQVTLKLTD